MTDDLRTIVAIQLEDYRYSIGSYCQEIKTVEKPGDMAYVIWYQLWRNGQVVKEVNSRYVVEVEYYQEPK